ncbi:MAG: alkaline phosphatase [bacterium]|jgi:predicted AlkP superfamily pyrophosphatase or phosphodiesterase
MLSQTHLYQTGHRYAFSGVIFLLLLVPVLVPAQDSPVRHVIIIGCDGLSPQGIIQAETPNVDQLMRNGAFTLHARAVLPTSSGPNWASLFMGAGPEQHGVISNTWQPDHPEIEPTVLGPGGIFPTIFSVIREQRPDSVTAVFHGWQGIGLLFERDMVDKIVGGNDADTTVQLATDYIREIKPLLIFIHIDLPDHAIHLSGFGSHEYYVAVERTDQYIGEVLQSLRDAEIINHSVLLVTSDHGGFGNGHGGATMSEIEIPWIITGPGITGGREIEVPVNIHDTAATIAAILNLDVPVGWISRPVSSVFTEKSNVLNLFDYIQN